MRKLLLVVLAGLLAGGGVVAGDDEKDRRDDIRKLERKLDRRFKYPNPTAEQLFLHKEAAMLLERTKQSIKDGYRFGRLARATDALLEASERILQAPGEKDESDDDRRKAALDLQRDYFRVQQADYFARQCKEKNAKAYVKHARRVYQLARRAFDAGHYDHSETLGDAAGYIVRALEYLAQAAIRVPEPPRL